MTEQHAIGVLLANLGTPDAPTTAAVRRYLAEFLSDPRVVDYPAWLWKPLLHGIILPVRSRRVAPLYRQIWTDDGSPLAYYSQRQREALHALLQQRFPGRFRVRVAMTYGQPDMATGLSELLAEGCQHILLLPLFPQYSATTTAACYDALQRAMRRVRFLPAFRYVRSYCHRDDYIRALADSVREHRQSLDDGERHLLFSFHGLPQRYAELGDPYPQHCQQTAAAVAAALGLDDDQWSISYQSRVGREKWLTPYTDEHLRQLGRKGYAVDVICPAFASDCLETLEEIAQTNRQLFMDAGGRDYRYIAALNARPDHVAVLANTVEAHCQGWL